MSRAPDGLGDLDDQRFMAAAIRLSRRHLGLTATNPSVATLIVRNDGAGPRIVGRGVTAIGGRPHAEAEALAEAGELARGTTAYVTLEPCAHHGRTPPCASALISAGVARVVGGASDPDERVSGRGYAMLREAGLAVTENVQRYRAADLLAGYLIRSIRKRPEVTLKLAVSADGMIGLKGAGQIAITGPESRAQTHLMRAESDAILIGAGTMRIDDPMLDCRLPGLAKRSPIRIVLDRNASLPPGSNLPRMARDVPLLLALDQSVSETRREELTKRGVGLLATEIHNGLIALPELLEDLSEQGIMSLMVEGGAFTARQFLDEGLVDRIALFEGPEHIGREGIASPVAPDKVPDGFSVARRALFGADKYTEMIRTS